MTYDVVMMGYERPPQLYRSVLAVKALKPSPVNVLVWHNWPSRAALNGVVNIYAGTNFGCRVRHAMGQLCPAEYVMFIDDDILVSPRVGGLLLAGCERHPNSVVGYVGRRVVDKYSTAAEVSYVAEDAPVSVVKGKLHMVRRQLLTAPFALEGPIEPEMVFDDDILLNACAQMQTGEPSYVVGGFDKADVTDLPVTKGVSLATGHFARRDATVGWLRERGWNTKLGWGEKG